MNYKKIYENLVVSRKSRIEDKTKYYESHHIKPKCFGGKGDGKNHNHENIVRLTIKEHFIAHLLLTKIYPDSPCMYKALWMMSNSNRNNKEQYTPSARMFEQIKSEYIKNSKGVNASNYGNKHSEETKLKIGLASIGRKSFLGKRHSYEAKKKMANYRIGKYLSTEIKNKISKSESGGNHYNAKTIICLKTGNKFGSGRELSEFINVPMSTIRGYLNKSRLKPEWFHYERLAYDS